MPWLLSRLFNKNKRKKEKLEISHPTDFRITASATIQFDIYHSIPDITHIPASSNLSHPPPPPHFPRTYSLPVLPPDHHYGLPHQDAHYDLPPCFSSSTQDLVDVPKSRPLWASSSNDFDVPKARSSSTSTKTSPKLESLAQDSISITKPSVAHTNEADLSVLRRSILRKPIVPTEEVKARWRASAQVAPILSTPLVNPSAGKKSSEEQASEDLILSKPKVTPAEEGKTRGVLCDLVLRTQIVTPTVGKKSSEAQGQVISTSTESSEAYGSDVLTLDDSIVAPTEDGKTRWRASEPRDPVLPTRRFNTSEGKMSLEALVRTRTTPTESSEAQGSEGQANRTPTPTEDWKNRWRASVSRVPVLTTPVVTPTAGRRFSEAQDSVRQSLTANLSRNNSVFSGKSPEPLVLQKSTDAPGGSIWEKESPEAPAPPPTPMKPKKLSGIFRETETSGTSPVPQDLQNCADAPDIPTTTNRLVSFWEKQSPGALAPQTPMKPRKFSVALKTSPVNQPPALQNRVVTPEEEKKSPRHQKQVPVLPTPDEVFTPNASFGVRQSFCRSEAESKNRSSVRSNSATCRPWRLSSFSSLIPDSPTLVPSALNSVTLIPSSPMVRKPVRKFSFAVEGDGLEVFYPTDVTVIKNLQRGAQGSVDLASTKFYKNVALKKFDQRYGDWEKAAIRELSSLLKSVTHPNIVQTRGALYESETERDIPIGVLMEFMDGGSARDAIYNEFEYPSTTPLNWCRQAASALAFLHKRELIHRDVKPANMLLCDGGKTLKISDFGLCTKSLKEMTTEVGTVPYMAPEITTTDSTRSNYNEKCDIYSLGISLWEMLHRRPPYRGVAFFALVNAVRVGERPKIDTDLCHIELENLMQRMWADRDRDRPDMEKVYNELEEMLESMGFESST